MIHSINYFKQDAGIKWQWPIHLTTLSPNPIVQQAIQEASWANKFIELVNVNSDLFNIIFLNDGFTQLKKYDFKHAVQADVIILRVDEAYFNSTRKDQTDQVLFKSIADAFSVSGIFIVHFNLPLSEWFDEFIIHLSHNEHICAALDKTIQQGIFYYDKSLETATKLSAQIQTIKEDLYELSNDQRKSMVVQTKLINQSSTNLENLLFFLEDFGEHFQYQRESGEAEGIAQLNISLQVELAKHGLRRYSQEWQHSSGTSASRGGPSEKDVTKPPSIFKIENNFSPEMPSAGAEPFPSNVNDKKLFENIPRFLQAGIIDTQSIDETLIVEDESKFVNHLKPNTEYTIALRIAPFDVQWKQGVTEFPTDKVFISPEQNEERIDIHFVSNSPMLQVPRLYRRQLILKRSGKSTTANFYFLSAEKNTIWEGQFFLYHKNRLIQKASLRAHVPENWNERNNYPPAQLIIDFSFANDFSSLEGRSNFGASFYYDSKGVEKPMQGISNRKPLDLYFSTALNTIVEKIKNRIQEAVVNIEDHPEDLYNEENVKLLLRLALDGNNLYVNHLKQQHSFNGPIQIVSNKSEFIPLDFVYTYAAPDAKSTLCPKAIEALNQGSCMGCEGIQSAPAKYICPFGFWGFSHVIERHTSERYLIPTTGDYTIIEEPTNQRETLHILQETLYAVSNKVSAAEPALNTSLDEALVKYSKASQEAETWTDWTKTIEQKHPDSLVLIVHIEKDNITDQDQLEIGEGEFLIQNLLDQAKLKHGKDGNPPFVILLGCEAARTDNVGFDVSSQLMNYGAAIVVSNFTKIRGRHAVPIVIKLLEFLKEQKGPAITLGEIILKLRQHFLAKGIIVSLALITHGDADWKIKT